jgi:uncharacterized membrane protein
MVLALLRRVLPGGIMLASLTWLACSPDSDITGPSTVGEPSFAEAVGEPVTWEPQPGVTVTMQFLGELVSEGWSQAWGIDDDNDMIVGNTQVPEPLYSIAFYWTAADGMQMIDAEGWKYTKAYDARDDVIVGSGSFDGQSVAFRRVGTTMQALYSNADGGAVAEVVYKDNTAFGKRRSGGQWGAIRWGPTFDQPGLAFGDGINIRDANDLGDVVGAVFPPKAFLWRNYPTHYGETNQVELEQLPLTPDGYASVSGQAEGVNQQTQVVGYMWGSSHNRAFIWDPVNKTSELDGLGEDYPTKALDISDNELIVGESELPDGDEHAVLWINRQPVDLHPPIAGATVSTAQAVNNNGLIAGHVWTADGVRAVVWTLGDGGGGGGGEGSAEEQLHELKHEIDDLEDAGVLNRGQANSMTKKVDNALKKIRRGKTKSAINKLNALINQINAFVRSGNLTPGEAQPLLDLARGAIDGLRGD